MKRYYSHIKLIIAFWIVCFLIKDFEVIRSEITNVLHLWSSTLIPSLFPYLVLSGYLTASGALSGISRFVFPVRKTLSLSADGAGVWLCSLFCGYPSGAVCTSELYSCGKISKNEAERLLCFTNNAGPLFLISAVGECMLGSAGDGVLIYVVQTVSAFITAVVLSVVQKSGENNFKEQKVRLEKSGKSFCECCQASVNAMLMICAYAVVASVFSKVVLLSADKLLSCLSKEGRGWVEGIVYGFFEISTALSKISQLKGSALTLPVMCALVSWSGVSVILQIKSVIPSELKTKKLFLSKAFQSLLSFSMAFVYQLTESRWHLDFSAEPVIKVSFVMCVVILVLFAFISRNQKLKKLCTKS